MATPSFSTDTPVLDTYVVQSGFWTMIRLEMAMRSLKLIAALVCGLFFYPSFATAQSSTSLSKLSNLTLVDCFYDHRCGEDYWRVSDELARRKPTSFLISQFWKTDNSQKKSGLVLTLSLIEAPEIAVFMREALDKKAIHEADDLFRANDYLGKLCERQALWFLSGSGTEKYFQFAACPEWARTVSYFGKCKYRPATAFLIKSVDAQCLDIGNAAATSLSEVFPDSPKHFSSVKAMKAYYVKRLSETN